MSEVKYPDGGRLELWVRDTGTLEGFTVYLDGQKHKRVFDGSVHKFTLPPPSANTFAVIGVCFGGVDGGRSALIDVSDAQNPVTVIQSSGMSHVYEIQS